METKCSELEAAKASLTQEAEKSQNLNKTLKKSLQDIQVDFLSSGDEGFEMAKAESLCITPDLDVSKMDFFKIIVNEKLVNMDEASSEVEDSRDVRDDNSTYEAQTNKYAI